LERTPSIGTGNSAAHIRRYRGIIFLCAARRKCEGRFAFGSAPVIGLWLLVIGLWLLAKTETNNRE